MAFGQNNVFFELLQQKPCRIIQKVGRKVSFGSEACEIGPKVAIWTCPDLSRRTSTYCKPAEILLFFQMLHLSFSLANFSFFVKTFVLLREFIMVYKIIGFTKRINLSCFMRSSVLLREFIIFIK